MQHIPFNPAPNSPAAKCRKLLEIAAPSRIPVLIQGETGSGKEVVAQTLHRLGHSAKAPFVAVNCGAIAPSLLESTLFGSVRGAYTGSQHEQLGLIRAAEHGTLFLDEIGELPLDAQSRLLRTLQERTVTPVGSHIEIPVQFRLVCATHRDLEELVHQQRFREDLLYRIGAFPIGIPPLRERPMDIPTIAQQIWQSQEDHGTSLVDLMSTEDMQQMIEFPWPGNVRQLRNTLERWFLLRPHGIRFAEVLLCEARSRQQTIHPLILSTHTPQLKRPSRCKAPSIHAIQQALQIHSNNRSLTAKELGISRGSLCYQLKKHS